MPLNENSTLEENDKIKIRLTYNLEVGSGRIVGFRKRRNRRKIFDHSFEQIEPKNGSFLSLYASAEADSKFGIIPFELIEFDQNSAENSPTSHLTKHYVIVLVVASAFFLCVLCNMVEKHPENEATAENVVEIEMVDDSIREIPKRYQNQRKRNFFQITKKKI